jgi:hypothetical protein
VIVAIVASEGTGPATAPAQERAAILVGGSHAGGARPGGPAPVMVTTEPAAAPLVSHM